MHFAVSGVQVSPWIPPLLAFVVSFFTSMAGVSGAFLLLPFQVSVLGFTGPAVSATNQLYNVLAIPGGVWRYLREGRMVWPLALVIVTGTVPGVVAGSYVRIRWLPDPAVFRFFAGGVLLYIGGRMAWSLLRRGESARAGVRRRAGAAPATDVPAAGSGPDMSRVSVRRADIRRTVYEFGGERHEYSTLGVLGLSAAAGVVAGAYGIGGGAIMAPLLVAVFGLPVHTVAGPALLGTFVASAASVVFYEVAAPFFPSLAVGPDWSLGILFGLGGLAGIYCGARAQKYVPAGGIRWILCLVVLFVAARYLTGF